MRLLIAGGGTGGHIYPALAVADSLRHRPNPPDLVWIGGHRGLEDRIVRAAGIPLRRLVLRSLRTVDRDVHLVADPARLALSVPQALVLTSIVIDMSVTALALIIIIWVYRRFGTAESKEMESLRG